MQMQSEHLKNVLLQEQEDVTSHTERRPFRAHLNEVCTQLRMASDSLSICKALHCKLAPTFVCTTGAELGHMQAGCN